MLRFQSFEESDFRKNSFGSSRRGSSSTSSSSVDLRHRRGSRSKSVLQSEIRPTYAPGSVEGVVKSLSRTLANATSFTILTGVLTLYALFGDDFRLALTSGDADYYFDFITFLALTAFSIEIAVCSLGKDGYWMSFYFCLDFVTTVSLIMDLTIVAQSINDWITSDEEGGSVAGAGRASRIGSKAGRIVRAMRLLRIVKLYRHAMEARQAKLLKDKLSSRVHPDEYDEDSEDDDPSALDFDGEPESRVGKKLSELTTIRVIILVLVMLFVVPQLTFSNFKDEFSMSTQYGADAIFRNWKQWCDVAYSSSKEEILGNTANSTPSVVHARRTYEKSLLLYAFFHGWQKTTLGECTSGRSCPAEFHMPLIWIGFMPPKGSTLPGPELQTTAYECLNPANLDKVNAEFSSDRWLYEMGDLPQSVLMSLSLPWNLSCVCGSDSCGGVNMMSHGVSGGADDFPCPQNRQMRLPPEHMMSGLRFSEITKVSTMTISSEDRLKYGQFIYYFDQRTKVVIEALLNIGQTLFVVVLLTMGALFFSKDANTLVLKPIERMIAKMEKIRDNPLAAMKLGDEEYRRENLEQKVDEKRQSLTLPGWWFWRRSKAPIIEPMETAILEKTIIKIGSLLALGFGEAGVNIIGQNMKGSDSAIVNAMIPGRRLDAIFGFCGICNFSDATEILQDKVMLFVNRIGEIVHGVVDEYQGVPNKNIGDAFLLVWLLPTAVDRRQRIADLSILSYCRIVQGVNESPVLAEYRGHPGLLQRLPNYRVELRFGFHCGWAIEGAIGSEYKIDASYLSPNVNMSSQLEAAAGKSSLSMLMSHFLYDVCSLPICRRCRIVDRIVLRGTNVDIGVYTMDLDISGIEVTSTRSEKKYVKNRYKLRQIREQMKLVKLDDNYSVEDFFHTDGINVMRQRYSPEFLKKFNMAFRNYEAGEWMVGKDMFENTQMMVGIKDGASTTLLAYMKQFGYVAPPTWSGFREFDM